MSSKKAEFLGWQETISGDYVALYNVGKHTWTEATLRAKGISVPETPPKPQNLRKGE